MNSPNPDLGEEHPHTNTQLYNVLNEHNRFKIQDAIGPPYNDTLTGPPFARLASDVDPYLQTAARWWTGDALGCLIVGGALLAWLGSRDHRRVRAAEMAAGAATLVAVTGAVFFLWAEPLAYLVLIPLGWVALRIGTRGAGGKTRTQSRCDRRRSAA